MAAYNLEAKQEHSYSVSYIVFTKVRILEIKSNNSSKSFFWIVHVAKFGERSLFGVVGSCGHNVVKNF